jgi:hypothetical protein
MVFIYNAAIQTMFKIGFKALKPRLMVMERLLLPGDHADEIYPSAQACTNLLIVPRFSNPLNLREKMASAINQEMRFFNA